MPGARVGEEGQFPARLHTGTQRKNVSRADGCLEHEKWRIEYE